MATSVTVNSGADRVIILGTNQAFRRKSTIGSAWNEVRIGMFQTVVPSGNDDAAATAETFTTVTYKDLCSFGLKNDTDDPPKSTGSEFLGVLIGDWLYAGGNANINMSVGGGTGVIAGSNHQTPVSVKDTSVLTSGGSPTNFWIPNWVANGHVFNGIKFVVNNRGLSTQTVTISHYFPNPATVYTDVSATNLEAVIGSATYNISGTFTWNAAGAALPLPDCFYAHIPFANNRLRISNYMVKLFS